MNTRSVFQNRWLRLAVIPFAIFFSTTWYYGWQYLSRLLLDDGTYSWKCDECHVGHPGWDSDQNICYPAPNESYVCLEQENHVQSLYTIMSSMEFVGTIFAGILYDLVGYRISLLVGYCLHAFGIFAVVQSHRGFQLYYPGAIATGLAVNIVAFPGYFIKMFFPRHGASVLILQLAAQTCSSSICYIIYTIVQKGEYSFRTCQLWFSIIGLPFVIMYYLVLPRNRQECIDQMKEENYDLTMYEQTRKTSMKDVKKAFLYWDSSAFAFLWYLPLVMCNNTWSTCLAILAGDEVSQKVGKIQAWQFLFSIAISIVQLGATKSVYIKWFPFGFLMFGTFVGLLALVLGTGNTAWELIAATIFLLGNSFIYASKYVYTEWVVDDSIYGMFTGTIGTVTGFIQLSNILWRSLAKNNLKLFVSVYLVVCVMASIIGCMLFYRVEKNKVWFLKFIVTENPNDPKNPSKNDPAIATQEEKADAPTA